MISYDLYTANFYCTHFETQDTKNYSFPITMLILTFLHYIWWLGCCTILTGFTADIPMKKRPWTMNDWSSKAVQLSSTQLHEDQQIPSLWLFWSDSWSPNGRKLRHVNPHQFVDLSCIGWQSHKWYCVVLFLVSGSSLLYSSIKMKRSLSLFLQARVDVTFMGTHMTTHHNVTNGRALILPR